MTSTLVIANFATGYETDREPFIINNDAFPVVNNAYIWRGRLKKKRGTKLLGRLQREVLSLPIGNTDSDGNYLANLVTIIPLNSLASIVPGSITVTIGTQIFVENIPLDGSLTNNNAGIGFINYNTGVLGINTSPDLIATPVIISFSYYPNLPVMGLEDFDTQNSNFPTLVAFDTNFSYQFNQSSNVFYDVTFYKNSGAPFVWSGQDYQQFWSANFTGTTNFGQCMWVTNGKPGFHFKSISAVPVVGANTQFTVIAHGLSNDDYVYINEVEGVTGVNGVSGVVTIIDADNFTLPTPVASGVYTSGGIVQYLTRSISNTQDGIKWYDGDPVRGTSGLGWVNFSPPLSNTTNPPYLVGANVITPFKDRLLFSGIYQQTSTGPVQYFPNRIVWCQNGTPYYSYPLPNGSPPDAIPDPASWFQNVVGRGGFLGAPIRQQIVTVEENEDVLLYGFEFKQLKLIYTADDSNPFIFQTINSELGSQSTFSGVSLDTGALTMGSYGIALTTQVSSQRIDIKIPDQIFEINSANNGDQRVTAIRDYRNEFIYFTYVPNNRTWIYPNKTLLYNYRDNTWATFDENYTHYGTFRKTGGYTWATIPFRTWTSWTNAWNFGQTGERYPSIIGGNQQGFVMIKDNGVKEDNSQYISSVNNNVITSPNHCLNNGDYILISGAIGPVASTLNGTIRRISQTTQNTFVIDGDSAGTDYIGGGVYARLTNLFVQTKQFPIFWERARKTRIGTQRFLFDTTDDGQVTVNVYASQNDDTPCNDPLISSYLIASNIVLTCAEPNNPWSENQNQIWHRLSNSFIGDTVQLGFELSDSQMRTVNQYDADISLHAIAIDIYPGPLLV